VLTNLKGSVPDWVQNMAAPDQGNNVARARAFFESHRQA
jgi:hypothetical protein